MVDSKPSVHISPLDFFHVLAHSSPMVALFKVARYINVVYFFRLTNSGCMIVIGRVVHLRLMFDYDYMVHFLLTAY